MEAVSQSLLSTRLTAGTRVETRTERRRACVQAVQVKKLCMQGSQTSKHRRIACVQSLRERIQGLQGRQHGSRARVHMGMHPEWRQVDNKIRRLEHRIADFRITSNDLRIQRTKVGSDDPEINQVKLLEHIKKREMEVVAEREALQKEMEQLTAYFHKGAQPEYKAVRRFFLSYLYHTSRKAFENFPIGEFDRVLAESPGGISFEWPERGSVTFLPHLCKKILFGKKISVSASGLDTSPLAIALAVLQAGAQKHCEDPSCRREECFILKEEYEQLFEAFFKCKIRILINQKSRGEMSVQYDMNLKIERYTGVKVS
ncbi:hypothetical protein GOP47_0022395 [Adiantum capillus-veneris]|uniref:Uncharacterized protein n=1 Tax=Adiantum capillus-veneris TaxID=13818 RepID=A0A9D4Z6T1_ADICA|nr:hypothetical protein GOP47_0022395 [Adiantum capillus-veneris]